jgi:AcrR family transcriptional regulator
MTTTEPAAARSRHGPRLSTDRVLRAAVEFADDSGIEAVTMRQLARRLGVEAMALYNHVANKEALLDGMISVVLGEIVDATAEITGDWKTALRRRILAAREVMLRHGWAPGVLESRADPGEHLNRYYDALIGLFRHGGFSLDLTHHVLHALGTRAFGYTHEPWDDSQPPPDPALLARQMAGAYPNIAAMLKHVSHDPNTTLGWCDDQFEFEFALDVLLEGLERRRDSEQSRTRTPEGPPDSSRS